MAFTPLNALRALFSSSNTYDKTPTIPVQSLIYNGQPEFLDPDSWNPYNIFLTTPQLYAVISRRGHLLASGQWKHYKADKDGRPVLIENSEVVKLLENPNPLLNGNGHLIQMNENMCIYGNNYEYQLRAFDSQAIPSGLTNIPPTQVGIKTTGKTYKQSKIEDIIKYYEIELAADELDEVLPRDMNHTRIPNSQNPIKGDSPMRSIYMPISNIRSAYQFRNVIMTKKGAIGILSNNSKDGMGALPLKPQERKDIEKAFKTQYGISNDQMQTIITEAGLTWQAMSYPTKDLMLFEEVDADFRTIIDQYGLNDNLFSREKGSTFANLAEGIKQAYQSTIIPLAEEMAMRYSSNFGLVERGEWLELDYKHITVLQENEKERAEILEKKANAMRTLQEIGLYNEEDLKQIINFDK